MEKNKVREISFEEISISLKSNGGEAVNGDVSCCCCFSCCCGGSKKEPK